MTAKENIELRLLENAIDFIHNGIDHLFADSNELRDYIKPSNISKRSYKYGVIHLFSGFLLLLKERLRCHIPELIFKGTLKEAREKLKNGKTPNTINLDDALERLEIGPKVVFSESDMQTIRRMQTLRNLFEHYEFSKSPYEIWSNVSSFLGLIDKFLVDHLDIKLESSTSESKLIQKIQTIETVWKRIVSIKEEEWRNDMLYKQSRFNANRDNVINELTAELMMSKGITEVFTICPECNQETLIIYGEYTGICTNTDCDQFFPISSCCRCGRAATGFEWEEEILCEDCKKEFRDLINSDD